MKELWLVSACLLGDDCKYNGGNNFSEKVVDFLRDKDYIRVCPEVAGGLPTPRVPCERQGFLIVDKHGEDKTSEFTKGAEACMKIGATHALLKARSPSCGKGLIYDGSFSGSLTEGNGVFAELCIRQGLVVLSEEDLP
ncbi:DUF523 domain-containing protein [Filifactor villosus]|uniref:DUF523 domain-containing protein n=1 Tax=Filifactor villosus TaxID=29374 RepID=A0ABV9QHB4_9FIRM